MTESTQPAPFCLHCGYELEGLPPGSICPECGHLSDREAERQAVLELLDRSMLKLGWRMMQFWKPLPPGWWWTLDKAEDRSDAKQRIRKWRLCCWLLMIVILIAASLPQREVSITLYEHPPNRPDKKQKLASGSSRGFGIVIVWARPRPGWVLLKEQTSEIRFNLDPRVLIMAPLFCVGLTLLAWSLMRWIWFSPHLRKSRKRTVPAHIESAKTAASYQNVPLLLLLLFLFVLFGMAAALFALEVIYELMSFVFLALPVLYLILAGTTWIAAIRADCTEFLFRHKLLSAASLMLLAGPGTLVIVGIAVRIV